MAAANGSGVARKQDVLVLWLDEDILVRDTQAKIELLANLLNKKCEGKAAKQQTADLRIAVLGPGYTSTLQGMISDLKDATGPTAKMAQTSVPPIAYYVYGATADDRRMFAESDATGDKNPEKVHEFFLNRQIALFRTVATDDMLAAKLKEELARRNVKPYGNLEAEAARERLVRHIGPKVNLFDLTCPVDDEMQAKWQHIVLIAERDSFYGRSLPRAMANEFAGSHRCRGSSKDDYPPWVHAYSYLRGLDGQLPSFQSGGDSGTGRKDDSGGDARSGNADRSSDPKRIERPEGQGQFDYLRRMTDQILALDDDLRVHKRGRIRAIGVLGTDVYDKLLILQALRAQFPDVLVFTTDIDARMLHPQQLEWTHNAIVASAYGLQLREQLQRDIAPFRDTYQTSLYLSTMIAVNHARLAAKNGADNSCRVLTVANEKNCLGIDQGSITTWLAPRIFEIGRKSAFDFSPTPTNAQAEIDAATMCTPGNLKTCSFVHPPPSRMYLDPAPESIQRGFRLLACALLLLGLVTGKWSQLGSWIVHNSHIRGSVAFRGGVAAFLLAVAAAFLYYLDLHLPTLWHDAADFLTEGGKGEPITLLQGVSIWPTQVIRAVALLLTVWFIFRGWRALDRNLDEISTHMMWQPERLALISQLNERNEHWHWWIRLARMFSFRLDEHGGGSVNPQTGLQPDAEKFWHKYIYQGRWWARLMRILVVTVIYHETFRFIGQSFGGTMPPYRGELLIDWNKELTYWTVYAMQFLLFSVVDATVFCHQLVSGLRRKLPAKPVADPAVATGGEVESRWPQGTLDNYAAKLRLDKRYLDDWIAMHFVARRTLVVARLVYYPFIIISLLVLARSSVFDNWGTSTGIVVSLTCSVLIVIGCAIALRSGAESLRRSAIWRLTNAKILLNKDDEGKRTASQIDVMIAQIRAFDTGAFAPYMQQPLVRALLLPLTSFGGTALAEYLSIANF